MKKLLLVAVALVVSLSDTSGFAASPPMVDVYPDALSYMQESGFLKPFSGWMTKPDAAVSRVEFLSLIVNHVYPLDLQDHCFEEIAATQPARYTLLYKDVKRTDANANVLCVGLEADIANGHMDGTFQPDYAINMAEAAKMLVKAYSLGYARDPLKGAPWYAQYLWDLNIGSSGMPAALKDAGHVVTRRDAVLLLYGLRARDAKLLGLKEKMAEKAATLEARPRTVNERPLHSR